MTTKINCKNILMIIENDSNDRHQFIIRTLIGDFLKEFNKDIHPDILMPELREFRMKIENQTGFITVDGELEQKVKVIK